MVVFLLLYVLLFVPCSTGVPLVLGAMTVSGSLETLDLGANGLTGAGLDTLLRGLVACSSLQTLEVGSWPLIG